MFVIFLVFHPATSLFHFQVRSFLERTARIDDAVTAIVGCSFLCGSFVTVTCLCVSCVGKSSPVTCQENRTRSPVCPGKCKLETPFKLMLHVGQLMFKFPCWASRRRKSPKFSSSSSGTEASDHF